MLHRGLQYPQRKYSSPVAGIHRRDGTNHGHSALPKQVVELTISFNTDPEFNAVWIFSETRALLCNQIWSLNMVFDRGSPQPKVQKRPLQHSGIDTTISGKLFYNLNPKP